MIKVLEIAFVGYPVTDIARARAFYEGVLQLNPAMVHEGDHGAWIEYEMGPHTLAVTNMGSEQWKPGALGASAALEVEDFDKTIAILKENQVNFVTEPFASPVCRIAVISDPDGNMLTIHKRNAS